MPDLQTTLAESQLYTALYGEIGQEQNSEATAAAQNITAQGENAEAGQYAIASSLSDQNAQMELISGQIQQFQTMRQLTKTLGAQQAGIAGAGFANSGSAISLARDSLQQGLLQTQVQGTNANLAASGYYQQAASSQAEATAATTAAGVAGVNSAAATNVANLSAQAATSTENFMNMIPGFNPANPFGTNNTIVHAANDPAGDNAIPAAQTTYQQQAQTAYQQQLNYGQSTTGGLPAIPGVPASAGLPNIPAVSLPGAPTAPTPGPASAVVF